MNKSKHQDIFEIILRTFLDWPSYELKAKLIEMLSMVDTHSSLFPITLSDTLNRLYNLKSVVSKIEM
jgi:hypothetical protein